MWGDHLRDYMDRRVTLTKQVTSPTSGLPPKIRRRESNENFKKNNRFSGKNKNLALWRPQTSEDEILFLFVNFDIVPTNSTPGGLPTLEKVSG